MKLKTGISRNPYILINMDLGKFVFDAALIGWTPAINTATIKDKIKHFNEKIIQLYRKYCPAPRLFDELKCLLNKMARLSYTKRLKCLKSIRKSETIVIL